MELLTLNDGSVRVLIAAPLMLVLIFDPVGLRVIGDNSCATCSGVFYNNAGQNADPRQPKGKNRKNYQRNPAVIGRLSAPGSPLRIVVH